MSESADRIEDRTHFPLVAAKRDALRQGIGEHQEALQAKQVAQLDSGRQGGCDCHLSKTTAVVLDHVALQEMHTWIPPQHIVLFER